ncbi:MAG TPA: rhomboid family intramembrane serine protease [Tenuifilaceae bacterium]|nr:rhomboid family intramembrane serine protease [Tenuifilaceae bacterium]HPV56484.1 rhomboid family intramembrane serine protease [Tenuifilaceae bacterium]
MFLFVIWLIKIIEVSNQTSFYEFGVFPREIKGLPGVVLAIFIHSDFNHLISNSISLFILFTGLLYFYRDLSYKVLIFIWLISGAMVWLGARESYHIGASGLIYGIASFLFFSGIIRQDIRLMAISMLVIFLYGGLIWGIFPIFPRLSWEYHLFGSICGLIAAVIYRKQGPQKHLWSWEIEDDSEEEETEKKIDTPNE